MQKRNRYYRGAGYHVDRHSAEEFADKYLDDDGKLINLDSEDFQVDLEFFLRSHSMVEEAYRTIETPHLFQELRDPDGVF